MMTSAKFKFDIKENYLSEFIANGMSRNLKIGKLSLYSEKFCSANSDLLLNCTFAHKQNLNFLDRLISIITFLNFIHQGKVSRKCSTKILSCSKQSLGKDGQGPLPQTKGYLKAFNRQLFIQNILRCTEKVLFISYTFIS